MNEQDNHESLDLPQPQLNQIPASNENSGVVSTSETAQSVAVEKIPAGVSAPINNSQASSVLPLAADDPSSIAASAQQLPAAQAYPLIADDADLIEKEWVNKAKEIVEKTKADPYQQNKEVNKVKADYLKKRYNKELKLAEDS